MTPLTRFVLATVAYYDALDYALTGYEVWRFLSYDDISVPEQYRRAYTLAEVDAVLQQLCNDQMLVCTQGRYTLPQRTQLVALRRRRMRESIAPLRSMQRYTRMFRYVPFVRAIYATGRLAARHGTRRSDWDVLVVLRDGGIWTGRVLVTIMTVLLGRRKTDRRHAQRFCLNYFITTASLRITLDDRFSAQEYMMARPLYSSINPRRFLDANKWINAFRPHYDLLVPSAKWLCQDTAVAYRIRKAGEWLCDVLNTEQILRRLQRAKILRNPKTFLRGAMIITNDRELVFLPNPHAPRVLEKYHRRCRALGLRQCA